MVVANTSPPDQETRPRPSETGQRHKIRLSGDNCVSRVRSSSICICSSPIMVLLVSILVSSVMMASVDLDDDDDADNG